MKKIFAVLGLLAFTGMVSASEVHVGEAGEFDFSILGESVSRLAPGKITFVVSSANKTTRIIRRWRTTITGCDKGGGELFADDMKPDFWTTPTQGNEIRMYDGIAATACRLANYN